MLQGSGIDIFIVINLALGPRLVASLDNHDLLLLIREFHYESWRLYLSLLKLLSNLSPLTSNVVSQVCILRSRMQDIIVKTKALSSQETKEEKPIFLHAVREGGCEGDPL